MQRVLPGEPEAAVHLQALPVGTYDLTAELSGFNKFERKALVVNVGQNIALDVQALILVTKRVADLRSAAAVAAAVPGAPAKLSSSDEEDGNQTQPLQWYVGLHCLWQLPSRCHAECVASHCFYCCCCYYHYYFGWGKGALLAGWL